MVLPRSMITETLWDQVCMFESGTERGVWGGGGSMIFVRDVKPGPYPIELMEVTYVRNLPVKCNQEYSKCG